MKKQEIIKSLSLQPHPSEGGYFKRTYTSEIKTSGKAGSHNILSSIYYLLTDDNSVGHLHRNKSDIIHYFHSGSAINYIIIHPDGQIEQAVLGNNVLQGETPQLTVKGGCWKASKLRTGEYGLISEAVSPGFEYEDMELANNENMLRLFPELFNSILPYILQT